VHATVIIIIIMVIIIMNVILLQSIDPEAVTYGFSNLVTARI